MANKNDKWKVTERNVGKYSGTKVARTSADGKEQTAVLLDPDKKAKKYCDELKNQAHFTNDGQLKNDRETGEVRPLTKAERSYRAGYLAARDDNAGAYLSNQAKTDPRFVEKFEARKQRKRDLAANRKKDEN